VWQLREVKAAVVVVVVQAASVFRIIDTRGVIDRFSLFNSMMELAVSVQICMFEAQMPPAGFMSVSRTVSSAMAVVASAIKQAAIHLIVIIPPQL
jgi:hypothetical protein